MPKRRPISEPPASSVVPSSANQQAPLTEDDRFALKCIRYRNTALAAQGCGDPTCAPATCLVARHARLILRALDALERAHAP